MEDLVLRLINQTQQPVFLTGRAGTGKTTLLKKIVARTYKNHVIVAPTAVAAINAGGVTIHSMFQLPFHSFLPTESFEDMASDTRFENRISIRKHFTLNNDKRKLFRNLELLVIDEVSMVRPDLLDEVDEMLRYVRQNNEPFGEVQVLFIGDLLQLPPIVRREEWSVMRKYYDSKYFFDAQVLHDQKPVYIELTKIYRQSDADFIEVLQRLRENTVDREVLSILESYVDRDFETQKNPGYIVLTTHNRQSDEINKRALDAIDAPEHIMLADVIGEFPESAYPLPERLMLKVGAQVMFVKNDPNPEKLYYNGKIGEISRMIDDEIYVYFPEEDREIPVEKYTWENIKYHTHAQNQEIEEEVIGTYTQYPIRLAWAITIHKSQGLTFEKAAIDISQVFAPGQAYVALSRLTSLDGLKLLAPIGDHKISIEEELLRFTGSQAPIEQVASEIDRYSMQYIIRQAISSMDQGAIQVWIRKAKKEIKTATEKNIWRKEKDWLEQLFTELKDILDISSKFATQLKTYLHASRPDPGHIHERIGSAAEYFYEQWVTIEKKLLQKMVDLSVASRVKAYRNSIHELEDLVYLNLKKLIKLKKANMAILNGEELDKSKINAEELTTLKTQWLKEIASEQADGLASLVELPSAAPTPKKEKIPSAEISLRLWEQHRDISKIAELRKLKETTIMGHLLRAVREDKLEIDALVELAEMQTIDQALDGRAYESLTTMREALGEEYDYDTLRLYRIWKEKQNQD